MVAPADVHLSVHEVKPLDDGSFVLDGIPPGDLFIAGRWTGDHPRGWHVASIRFGGQEGLNGPLRAQPGGAFSAEGLTPGEYALQAIGCAEAKRVRVERGAAAAVQIEPCR